jgi:putative tryptophan/tyrosine transport system substrate-binding protein
MRRREFIAGIAAMATVGLPWSACAQTNSSPTAKRIAIVDPALKAEELSINSTTPHKAYFTELNRLGYVEGRNLIVERYLALGQPERLPEVARAAVASHPDLIVADGGPVARQLKPLTTSIPIIAISGDPVLGQLVTNLARPDGNITGVSVDTGPELYGKRLEVLREATRKLTNVRLLIPSSAVPFWEMTKAPVQEAAARAGIAISPAVVTGKADRAGYERVFDAMEKDQVDGLSVGETSENIANRELIVELAARHRLPAIYPWREFVDIGGLLSYGIDLEDVYHRMANVTARVLSGAKPADIPYYQQTKFELVLNQKTARSLGLEFPPTLLTAADEVIE